jgi:purine-binding chemotaxis protein CheW
MARDELNYEDDLEDNEDLMEDKYLTFRVHERHFGVDIRNVVEIVVLPYITEVPDMPSFVTGIINLRGKVIPLVDMRSRFLLPKAEFTERTCVIIIESNNYRVGLVVDSVDEVIKINKDQMEPTPRIGDSITSRFVEKIGKVGEDVKIILNLNKLLNEGEIEAVKSIGDVPVPQELKESTGESAKVKVSASK